MKTRRILSAILAACMMLCLLPRISVSAADIEGTFTAATLNVDGLPKIAIGSVGLNPDGPAESGSKAIGQKLAEKAWDIVALEEDFNYHSNIVEGLNGTYNVGTFRNKVTLKNNNDTDGLNLLWKNSVQIAGESWTKWTDHYSGSVLGIEVLNGSDGMIQKGYRYYQATIAQGVYVDVYVLHMDADSTENDIAAREKQMTQLANAIKASNTHNPIIVMGDTNSRYTREHLETLFVDAINADPRFTVKDAWVEKVRNGVYPEYGTGALVDNTKTDLSDTDIPTPLPQAEVVDKIFYINNTDSCVTLNANSYTVDKTFVDSEGKRLADHWPVVVEFSYEATHEFELGQYTSPTCTGAGKYTFTCDHCLHTEVVESDPLGHYYKISEYFAPTCTVDGYINYKCEDCGAMLHEVVQAGHDYYVSVVTEAGCISNGRTRYQCANCDDYYWVITQEALGHNFVDGQCTHCNEYDENYVPDDVKTWGSSVASLQDGHQYAIVFPSTNYSMALSHNTAGAMFAENVVPSGEIGENLLWTVNHVAGGYTISTEVNGQTMYLARAKTQASSGYKLTLQKTSFVWTVKMNATQGTARVTTKVGSSTYTLRYYSSTTGWIVSSKAADIQFYSVNG